MKKLKKSVNFGLNRGQLNIAEVVISAAVILILTIAVAQLGSKIVISQEGDSINYIKEQADQILSLTLEQGILRNLTYTDTADPDFPRLQAEMTTILNSRLPLNVEYSLYQITLDNTNFRLLAGLDPLSSSGIRISTSIFVGGIVNTILTNQTYYIVTLLMNIGG